MYKRPKSSFSSRSVRFAGKADEILPIFKARSAPSCRAAGFGCFIVQSNNPDTHRPHQSLQRTRHCRDHPRGMTPTGKGAVMPQVGLPQQRAYRTPICPQPRAPAVPSASPIFGFTLCAILSIAGRSKHPANRPQPVLPSSYSARLTWMSGQLSSSQVIRARAGIRKL